VFLLQGAVAAAATTAILKPRENTIDLSQRGHTIPLDDKILGLLIRLLVTGKMCE
jgi:hypothetical protein